MNHQGQSLKHRIQQLPPLPPATSRLLEMLEDDSLSSDMKLIERQILTDPVLTGRILQIANSSFYGLRQQVVSISQACSILGIHTLKSLVYSMVLMQRLNQPHDQSVVDYGRIWRHSLLTACLAGAVLTRTRLNHVAVFTTGLFHNIGLLIMDLLNPQLLQKQIELARKQQITLEEAVREQGAPAHSDLAVTTLEVWNIPDAIIAPFRPATDTGDGESGKSASLNWVRYCALLAQGLGEVCLEGVPLPLPEPGGRDPLDKDLAELPADLDQGVEAFRELKAHLL